MRKYNSPDTSVRHGIARGLHTPARRLYGRRRVLTNGLHVLWQADLVDMHRYASVNCGMRYILTVIDVDSKFAWAEALKKTGEEMKKAFGRLLRRAPRKPNLLQTDAGTEFYNAVFSKYLRAQGIRHYSTFSSTKAAVVERFNRTLNERMWRRFSGEDSHRWVAMLHYLLREYNTKHRTIGMKPKDVKDDRLMRTVYSRVKSVNARDLKRFRVGDVVRVSKHKMLFQKGYEAAWSTELFKIARVDLSQPVTYSLEDLRGERIAGRFYKEELQLTHCPDQYLVERVLRKRGDNATSNGSASARDIIRGYMSGTSPRVVGIPLSLLEHCTVMSR